MSSPAPATSPLEREWKAESPAPVGDSARNASEEKDVEKQEEMKPDAGSDAQPEEESRNTSPAGSEDAPPLPSENVPDGPPLPNEPVPQPQDDGWDCQWDPTHQAWYFCNRFTGKTQWENPRVPSATSKTNGAGAAPGTAQDGEAQPPTHEKPAAGGYNPAIHGDYDPNAWYAQGDGDEDDDEHQSAAVGADPSAIYGATVAFNRHTGSYQTGDMGPERHSDEAKSRRQMNAFFDVDAAANSHGGRSLKAERSNKKPTKTELKAFKEKRRARKEEKRRAWLRD